MKSGKKIKSTTQDAVDPLSTNVSGGSGVEPIDPLSMFAAENATTMAKNKRVVGL